MLKLVNALIVLLCLMVVAEQSEGSIRHWRSDRLGRRLPSGTHTQFGDESAHDYADDSTEYEIEADEIDAGDIKSLVKKYLEDRASKQDATNDEDEANEANERDDDNDDDDEDDEDELKVVVRRDPGWRGGFRAHVRHQGGRTHGSVGAQGRYRFRNGARVGVHGSVGTHGHRSVGVSVNIPFGKKRQIEEQKKESAVGSEGKFLKAVSKSEDSKEELVKNDETKDIEDLVNQSREKKNWHGGVTGSVRHQGGRTHGSIGAQGRYRFRNGARVSVHGSVGTHGHGAGVSVNIPFGKKRQIEQGQKKDSAASSDGKFLKAVSESEDSKEELVKESPVNSESKFLKAVSESKDIKEELKMDSAAIFKSKFTKAVSESEDSKEELEMESADNSEDEFLKAVSEFEDITGELEKNDETEDIEDLANQTREKKNWRGGVTGRVRHQGGRTHGSVGVQGRYRFRNGARVSVHGSVGTHGHGAGVSVNIPFGKKRQIEQEKKKESVASSEGKFLKAVSESDDSKEILVKASPVNSESKFLKAVSESDDSRQELVKESAVGSESKFLKEVSESDDNKDELVKNDETEDIEDLVKQTREKKSWRGGVTGRVTHRGGRTHSSVGVQGRYRFGNGARVGVHGSVGTHGHRSVGVSVSIPFGKKRQIEEEHKKKTADSSEGEFPNAVSESEDSKKDSSAASTEGEFLKTVSKNTNEELEKDFSVSAEDKFLEAVSESEDIDEELEKIDETEDIEDMANQTREKKDDEKIDVEKRRAFRVRIRVPRVRVRIPRVRIPRIRIPRVRIPRVRTTGV